MTEAGAGVQAPRAPLASSFRDPDGVLFCADNRVFRIVNETGLSALRVFLSSSTASKWIASGGLVRTSAADPGAQAALLRDPRVAEIHERIHGAAIFEHERIPFPSYAYEWPPEMLHAAAALTIDLALDLLPESLGLKDATPYNVLFRGPAPVFIDALSAERRDPGDPVWLPYAQFVRTFLLPLAANRHLGLALDQLLFTRRDGLEPEEVYEWLSPPRRLRPPFLTLVSMPVWLAGRRKPDDDAIYRRKILADAEKARFILASLLKGLKRTVASLAPSGASSAWTGYMEANNNYTAGHFHAKEEFVAGCLAEAGPGRVLDVGCNTGHFSFLAARSGAGVVAIDYDPAVAGAVWRKASAEKLDVLPLVVNLARPTPGVGWNNSEWPSFLDRARGSFDMVLMLAVIHHMMVTERVPLDDIVDMAAELTAGWLAIEFISPEDSMFRRLVRGRDDLYRDLDAPRFEASCRRRFHIVRSQHVDGSARWLYLMRKKTSDGC